LYILPRAIVEELEKRARALGISIDEYIFDLVLKEMNSERSSIKYLEGAEELLKQASEEVKRGNLRQASKKIWGACALAIKAHALAKKGIKLESHRDLWIYKNEVAKELGDWVRAVFRQADSIHKNFYENQATKEDIEDTLREVEKLVKATKEIFRETHSK